MAQRSPLLSLSRDWRLADERARLLAPLAEAPTDIDRVARLSLGPQKCRVFLRLRNKFRLTTPHSHH